MWVRHMSFGEIRVRVSCKGAWRTTWKALNIKLEGLNPVGDGDPCELQAVGECWCILGKELPSPTHIEMWGGKVIATSPQESYCCIHLSQKSDYWGTSDCTSNQNTCHRGRKHLLKILQVPFSFFQSLKRITSFKPQIVKISGNKISPEHHLLTKSQ